jgi:integrase
VVGGRTYYFGPWGDPEGALEKFLDQKDHLFAGRTPPPAADGLTLHELVNRFLAAGDAHVQDGTWSIRHFVDCKRDGAAMLAALGKARPAGTLTPADFQHLRTVLSKGPRKANGPTALRNRMIRVKSIFRWAYVSGLAKNLPAYGQAFRSPSAKALRLAAAERGPRDYTAKELWRLLDAAAKPRYAPLRAMIFLGINCGFGNTDCSDLREEHLTGGPWGGEKGAPAAVELPRGKTGVARRALLWPETVEALTAALARRDGMRGIPPDLADRLFLTEHRREVVHTSPVGSPCDAVGQGFLRAQQAAGLKVDGSRGFYSLRRTFRTVADSTRDWPAVDVVMGHLPADAAAAGFAVAMGARYRQRIGDDRLAAVAEHVRAWLLAGKPKTRTTTI